jgi:hypothetical protein
MQLAKEAYMHTYNMLKTGYASQVEVSWKREDKGTIKLKYLSIQSGKGMK